MSADRKANRLRRTVAKPERPIPIVFLQGANIYFRPLELADFETCQRWINDLGTRQFLLNVRPMNAEAERDFIQNLTKRDDGLAVGIVCRRDQRLIGSAGLHGISWTDRRAAFGILIGEPAYRGRGYGTEATKLMLKHAFETLNLNRVELDVYEFNVAGIRAYEKAGFTREGVLRAHHYGHGRYHDVYRYGILAREYFERVASGDGAIRRANQNPARKSEIRRGGGRGRNAGTDGRSMFKSSTKRRR
ncbi:MAG TPA: GNAT family protein [Phycisphaerae bacterium]|jgi:RimJ/RimL family protein N-acetyltransferase